jgi:hypothetical protein
MTNLTAVAKKKKSDYEDKIQLLTAENDFMRKKLKDF